LLADEPTGALDSNTGKDVLQLLFEVHREENLTVLLVTHDLNIAAAAHRRIEFKDGRVVRDASGEGSPAH
jgi:ABC-type lipoprotein export system ATPase subunit